MKWPIFVLAGLLPVFAAAVPVPLIVDPAQSRVEIVVKATVDSFTGTLDAYKADISVDAGRVVAGTFGFRFDQVHTGKDGRDAAMHEWQETPKHPDGLFTLTSIETAADGHLTAKGSLAFHGVTKDMAFPVSVTTDRKLYSIDGEASLDTREFGLPIIRKFALLKVDPIVKVRFHLQGSVAAR
ncbi:MAG TPA: YceI family protein [Luteolibacter sp.]